MRARRFSTVILLFAVSLSGAPQPWRKDYSQWAKSDVDRVLNDSPWAQTAAATFPDTRQASAQSVYDLPGAAQAGLPAPKNAATDGRWDGGVGRNTGAGMLPTLSVLVRWDSALPVRQALLRSGEFSNSPGAGAALPPSSSESSLPAVANTYELTVIGLIPANQYQTAGKLRTKSTSDSSEGTTRPASDTEQVLEGLMGSSRLFVRGKPVLQPQNVKIDPETGVIHVYFPRSVAITRGDKEVIFSTRFGSLSLNKRFRLNEMMYQNRLEL